MFPFQSLVNVPLSMPQVQHGLLLTEEIIGLLAVHPVY